MTDQPAQINPGSGSYPRPANAARPSPDVATVGATLQRMRWLTIVVPLVYIALLAMFSMGVLVPLFGNDAPLRLAVVFVLLGFAVVPFSLWVFSLLEQQLRAANAEVAEHNRQLAAVNAAMSSISSDLDLRHVLQNIADAARDLAQSRYAALGVADETGRIIEFITSGISDEQRAAIGALPQGHGLIGVLISQGTPLRIPNIAADPRSAGFPPNHPPMTSLLGVPILFQGRAIGDLYLTDKIGDAEFGPEDEELLLLLAGHAAVAIENARLYEDARAARDRLQAWSLELEERVAERTREIERYSKELTTRVLQAQEEERKRIARELHDDTAQSLSSLMITLDLCEPLIGDDNQPLHTGLGRVRELTRRTLDGVRALSHDLRPTILDDFGLIAALHWFADEYTRTFGVPVEVHAEQPDHGLTPELELALFRIAQEALTNSGKYAEATRACI